MYNHPLYQDQITLEATWRDQARTMKELEIAKQKAEGGASSLSIGQRLIDREYENAINNVQAFVEHATAPRKGSKSAYVAILLDLQRIYKGRQDDLLNLLTFITFSTLLNGVMRQEYILSNLAKHVGQDIQHEARLDAFLQASEDHTQAAILKGIRDRRDQHFKTYYAERFQEYAGWEWVGWNKQDLQSLGACLIDLVKDGTGYFEEYQAGGQKEIRPTQWLIDTWKKNEARVISRAFRMCPTIIPPKPWEDFYTGGYYGDLSGIAYLLRLRDISDNAMNVFSKEYLARLSQLELSEVREAVNAIQETPWVINQDVLEVAQAIIQRGGAVGGIPALEPIPALEALTGDYTEDELKKHKQKLTARRKAEASRCSKAARALATVEVAKKFSGYEAIYFPWNMDFRGRCYPISSFNSQGDDLMKALLLFADPPACTSIEDISWLAIHGANLAGVDKVSFEERIAWVNENEEHILRSAADPLGYRWWAEVAKKDYPLQFIGWCIEWARWVAYWGEHGTAEGFKCGIAIAFDGSCSGLQHFSAILRDPIGGQAVNLVPGAKPQDIYRQVAEKVNEQLKKDAVSGTADSTKTTKPKKSKDGKKEIEPKEYLALGTKTLAQEWISFGVDRKVTKRSVMTLAYGSKEYGFAEQLQDDIIGPAEDEGRFYFANRFQAGKYLAKLIWNAVKKVVVKAVEGMNWLQSMARLVTKDGHVVTWSTPLGLPVQQSYMACEPYSYQLRYGGKITRLWNYRPTGDINKVAQANGIAPNFIHSMDACHLMMTVLMAKERGIRHFAMVHDSYGAPLAQAGLMFRTVREAFVQMYTENNVLEAFQADMMAYIKKDDEIPSIPEKGDLDINQVVDSLYAFC